jgi:hypothetical protein
MWLGISGPITSGVVGPVTVLRVLNYAAKWQTLMTGCLAIVGVTIAYQGAVLAYRAAMAKVDLDRGRERRELERKQLGLYLRLHFATNKLVNEAQSVVKTARTSSVQPKKFSPMHIRLTLRSEFDEAWTSLDLLPVSATVHVDAIRTIMPRATARLDSFPAGQMIEIGFMGVRYADPLYAYLEDCDLVIKAGNSLLKDLQVAAEQIEIG